MLQNSFTTLEGFHQFASYSVILRQNQQQWRNIRLEARKCRLKSTKETINKIIYCSLKALTHTMWYLV